MESNRWWESYFVRYITGSGVGAIIVHLTLKKLGIDLIPSYEELQSTNLVVLSALGFIFCYVASAPIALLHAVRGISYLKSSKDASSLKTSFIRALTKFDWFFLLALLVMAALGLLLAFSTYPMLIGLSAASMMVPTFFLWIAVKQYLKSDKDIEWERWYFNLAISRAKDSNAQSRRSG